MDVIQFFNDVADSEEALSRITHKLCRNIIQGLDEATLRELCSRANLDWYLRKLVGARLDKDLPMPHRSNTTSRGERISRIFSSGSSGVSLWRERSCGRPSPISSGRRSVRSFPSSYRTRRRMRGLGHCRPLCISGRCSLGERSD